MMGCLICGVVDVVAMLFYYDCLFGLLLVAVCVVGLWFGLVLIGLWVFVLVY